MTPKLILVTACAVLLSACSESNNLLLGTVSTNLDSHRVVVTDCYRTEVPPPEHFVESGVRAWRYAPCRDAVIEIHGDKLNVNGRSYGHIDPTDAILVDHGAVSIQRRTSQRASN